jgi:hypothetical protein
MDYSEQQLAAAITVEQLRPVLMTAASGAPPGLAPLIERCWHSDPEQRPDLQQVIDELERLKAALERGEKESSGAGFGVEGRERGAEGQTNWREAAETSVPLEASVSAVGWDARKGVRKGEEGGYRPTVASGVFETRGARDRMEDKHVAIQNLGDLDGVHLFGVFDGHRGKQTR